MDGIKLFSAGDSSDTIIDGDDLSTVIYFPGLGSISNNTVIRGFRITNGGNVQYGGGIRCEQVVEMVLTNVTLRDNSAQVGGGIYIESTPVTLSETLLYSNTASEYGGGIYCTGSSPTFEHCTIAENEAGMEGDGVYTEENAWPTFSYCNFWGNGTAIHNNDNSQLLQAPNNWWGDASGPYHPNYNPGGQGDSVNAFVYPLPFLTEPDPTAPPVGIIAPRNEFKPNTIVLNQNFPNPFNSSTMIIFDLPNPIPVKLTIYDITGCKVGELLNDLR